ncbi:hypothetical protein SDC9_150276 [bioreactor metagenome]|uniref:Uncharacterized protein n=1 Tax=bioreactor metagenome TaxID=1076179 RepID=A0A645ER97_9ZZZZ
MQPRQIKGFAGRRAGDGDIRELLLDCGENLMAISRIDKIGVNFVRNNFNAVLYADISNGGQLILCPYPADRIVRTTKNKKLHMLPDYFFFKVG